MRLLLLGAPPRTDTLYLMAKPASVSSLLTCCVGMVAFDHSPRTTYTHRVLNVHVASTRLIIFCTAVGCRGAGLIIVVDLLCCARPWVASLATHCQPQIRVCCVSLAIPVALCVLQRRRATHHHAGCHAGVTCTCCDQRK